MCMVTGMLNINLCFVHVPVRCIHFYNTKVKSLSTSSCVYNLSLSGQLFLLPFTNVEQHSFTTVVVILL